MLDEEVALIRKTREFLYKPHNGHVFTVVVRSFGNDIVIMQKCDVCDRIVGFVILQDHLAKIIRSAFRQQVI